MLLSGSETSSPPATSPQALSTSEVSKTCSHPTLWDSGSAISSLASEYGLSLSVARACRMTLLFGREAAPANLSASQAREAGWMTSGICGLRSSTSSSSAALQSSLESRLRQRLTGSASCEVIWKPRATPWATVLWKPRALVRTISGIVFGLWPTMTSNAPARDGYNEAGNSAGQVALRKIALALWSTIRASDGEKGGPNQSFGAGGSPLPSQVSAVASTSNAPTESGGGSLHPEFAGWVMGFPPEWLSCAPSATQSTRARRKRSSKR